MQETQIIAFPEEGFQLSAQIPHGGRIENAKLHFFLKHFRYQMQQNLMWNLWDTRKWVSYFVKILCGFSFTYNW